MVSDKIWSVRTKYEIKHQANTVFPSAVKSTVGDVNNLIV